MSDSPNGNTEREPEEIAVKGYIESRQRLPDESVYRYYRRRVSTILRKVTHEQSLVYGTWTLAIGTWVIAAFAYCALKDGQRALNANQRAWVGPRSAGSDKLPMVGQEFSVTVDYENTGREPATNLVLSGDVFAIPINTTTSEEREAKIIAYRNRCFTTNVQNGAGVVFPTNASAPPRTFGMDKDNRFTDNDIVSGQKFIVAMTCFAYKTVGMVHHTSYCVYYQAGKTPFQSWNSCRVGIDAD
ncbi:MAG TPA: hypothetical protein VGK96_21470 [Candidatus Sulfotelmatobacter sp.]|jgi:hypothetical protein|nr:hypothetical protein [Pseudolabrys sp.]